jgi:hypothetical protein
VTLPSSNRATGSSGRSRPARRRLPSSSRARRLGGTVGAVRAARAAATLMETAASAPGTRANQNEARMPTVATSSDASSGPTTAPRLSPARSTPNERP